MRLNSLEKRMLIYVLESATDTTNLVRSPLMARCIDTTLCDKICQCLCGQWFSPGTPVSSTNKTYCHHITEILLKVAVSTITLTLLSSLCVHWEVTFQKKCNEADEDNNA